MLLAMMTSKALFCDNRGGNRTQVYHNLWSLCVCLNDLRIRRQAGVAGLPGGRDRCGFHGEFAMVARCSVLGGLVLAVFNGDLGHPPGTQKLALVAGDGDCRRHRKRCGDDTPS